MIKGTGSDKHRDQDLRHMTRQERETRKQKTQGTERPNRQRRDKLGTKR